jgi:hypothetical protein
MKKAYNEFSSVPLLSRSQVDPVVDHDGLLIAKVIGDALCANGALCLHNGIICKKNIIIKTFILTLTDLSII